MTNLDDIPMKGTETQNQDENLEISAVEVDKQDGSVYILDQKVAYNLENKSKLVPSLDGFKHFTHDKITLETLGFLCDSVNNSTPTLLEGETAASKTSSIEYLAALSNNSVHRLNLNGQTDTSELIGKFIPNDGQLQIQFEQALKNEELLNPDSLTILKKAKEEQRNLTQIESEKIASNEGLQIPEWRWQDGIIPRAMKNGDWVILDEINLAEAQILERLNPVLESSPNITLSENGGVKIGDGGDFELNENFRIFATMNPAEYAGRQSMSPAYKDRWQGYKFVKTPGESEYNQMLSLMTYGDQPEVDFNGENYSSPEAESLFPQLKEITNFHLFLPLLSRFHTKLVELSSKREIGKDGKEKIIFTRRGLLSFMKYLETTKRFNRRVREEIGIKEDPVKIILLALESFYFNKVRTETDRKKIQDQLDAIGITPEKLSQMFESPETIQSDTEIQAKSVLGQDPNTQANPESLEGYEEKIEALKKVSNGRFQSPSEINENLKQWGASIPASELNRLNNDLKRELDSPKFNEFYQGMQALKERVEKVDGKEMGPLITKIPKVFTYNEDFEGYSESGESKTFVPGEEIPFTLNNFANLSQKIQGKDNSVKKPLFLGSFLKDITKNKVWEDSLRGWTSSCLEGSKSKAISNQEKFQKDTLGDGYEVRPDMMIAMYLRYLNSDSENREELMRIDWMRLNRIEGEDWTTDSDGDPLCLLSDDGCLGLAGSNGGALSDGGLGASLGISS